MKILVVNADDFGVNMPVNKGIMFCHKNGIVNSTSLMANMPEFDTTIKMLKNIDTGIHLNLTWGKPLTKAKSLINHKGHFKNDMILRMLMGKLDKYDIEEELKAQITKVKKYIKPAHVNSHQHFHVFPFVRKMVAEITLNNKIPWIRLPNESLKLRLNRQTLNLLVLKYYSRKASKDYDELGLKYPNAFFGIADTGSLTLESFKKILTLVKDGVTEIMCHPGYPGKTLKLDKLKKTRMQELELLTHPEIADTIKQQSIKLKRFGEI